MNKSTSTTTPSSTSSATSLLPSNSSGRLGGSRKLLGALVNPINGGLLNWTIPPFPEEKKNIDNEVEENEEKQFVNRRTQVEDRDWVLLEVQQISTGLTFDLTSNAGDHSNEIAQEQSSDKTEIDNGDGENRIVEGTKILEDKSVDEDNDGVIFTRKVARVRTEQRIDRGTTCDDFPGDFGLEEKIAKLAQSFPLAGETHIVEVLNACHGDYNWAFNLLNQFNDEHFAASSSVNFNSNNNDVNTFDELAGTQETIEKPIQVQSHDTRKVEQKYECEIENKLISDSGSSQQQAQFSFYLDPAFAVELQSTFGQVLKEGEIDEKFLQVKCSSGVARLIHHLWTQTYYESASKEPVRKKPSPNMAMKPFTLSSFLNKPISQSRPTNSGNSSKKESTGSKEMPYEPKSAFQEIMDLEMALNLSRKEANSKVVYRNGSSLINGKHLMSTKIKREHLRAVYPGLDEQVLEQIFEANDYRISETIESIDDSFGIQTTITPELGDLMREENGYFDYYERTASPSRPFSPNSNNTSSNGDTMCQIRAKMAESDEKRRELLDKAHTSYQAKKYAVASYYTDQAREYQKQIDDLRAQLIDSVVRANPSNILDLHGVHSNEVLTTLSGYLTNKYEEMQRKQINKLNLFIITGRGAHSVGGPKLKPLVIRYLEQKGYKHEILNPGVINVTIR